MQDSIASWKLNLLCEQLRVAIQNEEACKRYEKMSRTSNRLKNQEPYIYKGTDGKYHWVR